MKLFEYNVLINFGYVVAAEAAEQAQSHINGLSAANIADRGEIGDVCDMELIDEREVTANPLDESHDVAQGGGK